ncbi:MAG: asparaginase, partial [Flavobacteriales bacterium]|nr:asparaginase [Flavobacteriales bacterium]
KVTIESFDIPLDSSAIGPKEWLELVDIIASRYDEFDGFVILHGTDTMAYSASALGFLLNGLNKAVVFTGSQLPISEVRSDARDNLITAIEISASQKVPEVSVLFDNNLYRGVRSIKKNAENFDAFDSPNFAVLATAGVNIKYNLKQVFKSEKQVSFFKKVNQNVASIKLFPGMNLDFYISILEQPELQGLVLEVFGTGTVSFNKAQFSSFYEALKVAIERGVIVMAISQCSKGVLDIGRYEASSILLDLNVISGKDLTLEAAVSKMMIGLANFDNITSIKNYLLNSQCGEF